MAYLNKVGSWSKKCYQPDFKFLVIRKDPVYENIVQEMLNYKSLGSHMSSLQNNFFKSHIYCFSKKLGDNSEEQGKKFHQDIKKVF